MMRGGENFGSGDRTEKGDRAGGADWSILERYADEERRRVDEFRNELTVGRANEAGEWQTPAEVRQDFEREKSDREPTKLRKLGRAVLGALGLEIAGSRKEQEREAMGRALREREDELVEREMDAIQMGLAKDVQEIFEKEEAERLREDWERWEEEEWEKDRENREKDFVQAMGVWRNGRGERIGRERAQEILERKLDEKLTRVDYIREQAEAGNPEVGRRALDYMGQTVEVFDLKGLPFAMLSHAVDYRALGFSGGERVEMANMVVAYPEFWTRNREAMRAATNGGEVLRAESLSTSYVNSESNIDTRVGTSEDAKMSGRVFLCYGFDHGGALLKVKVGDAGTAAGQSVTDVNRNSLSFFEEAEGSGRPAYYNEVALKRYLENGEARRPDYIIAENGQITETMLKHAAYFNVPILNIEKKYYDQKFAERAEKILGTIGSDSSFQEVEKAVSEVGKMAGYVEMMRTVEEFDSEVEQDWWRMKGNGIARWMDLDDGTKGKMMELLKLEAEKRLEFINEELESGAEEYREATEAGKGHEFKSEFLEDFRVKVYADGKEFSEAGVEDGVWTHDKDWVDVSMTIKNDGREIKTRVYRKNDGEGVRYEATAARALEYLREMWKNKEVAG